MLPSLSAVRADGPPNRNESMDNSLTICIPTCGRPEKLHDCISGIRDNSASGYPILVLDSGSDGNAEKRYRNNSDVQVIHTQAVVGPGEARNLLSGHAQTDFLLFLDDDLVPLPNAIELLNQHVQATPGEIFAGVWQEGDGFREAGQLFIDGRDTESQSVITKKFVTVEECRRLDMQSIKVDGCMASFTVAQRTLEAVNFDPAYRFFYELFDFFLQCRDSGIDVNVVTDAKFRHQPGGYQSQTNRDLDSREDRVYFESKWKRRVAGSLGGDNDSSHTGKRNRRITRLLRKRHS